MRTKGIFIIGYFGFKTNQIDGQTIKTRNVLNLLNEYQVPYVDYYDTQEFQFNRMSIMAMIFGILRSRTLLYLPGQKNLKTVFPLIFFLSKMFRVKIINLAVGGWLADFLGNNPKTLEKFRNFKMVFVESDSLKKALEDQHRLLNVEVFPNFRLTNFIPNEQTKLNGVFKLVFMARVTKEKGLKYLFDYADYCNNNRIQNVIIDFYGPIDEKDREYFEMHVNKYAFVNYKGFVEPENVFATLSGYSVLALPSFYSGEGFPGTIIDSYIAGIPVVVSNWKFLPEFVDHGSTGFVFDLKNSNEFIGYLEQIRSNLDLLKHLKNQAFNKSKIYSAEKAWELLKVQL